MFLLDRLPGLALFPVSMQQLRLISSCWSALPLPTSASRDHVRQAWPPVPEPGSSPDSCYLIGNKIWIQHMTFCFLDKVNEVDPKVFMKNKFVSGTLGTTEEQLEASTLRIPIPAL